MSVSWMSEVVEATAGATSVKALVKQLGAAMPVKGVALRLHDGRIVPHGDIERGREPTRVSFDGGELDLYFRRGVARPTTDDLDMIAALVTTVLRHLDRIAKLATLSRSAHVEKRDLLESLALERAGGLVARSDAMLRVVRQVGVVSRHDTTVLLRGGSGTGKELVARRIHQLSSRARGPFVAVNCGAIPSGLEESELFGHEAGAFTGAARRHIGRFQRASGGTLFLDEVAELSPSAQVKLLRALQERRIEPVGAERELDVDVRVIAATHQPVEELLVDGRFRRDLYSRLNVFPIVIPPLRERPDDVPALCDAILRRLGARLGLDIPTVPAVTMRALCDYGWPGNVRELENVLERALIQTPPGEALADVDLPSGVDEDDAGSVTETFDEAMRAVIERALRQCRGRLYGADGAAARLRVNPSTLQSRMKKLNIDRAEFARGS